MTRPPVGSTGTLAELQVEPGDVYQHFDGKRYQARWNNGELYNFDLLSGCWGVSVFESEQEYALISRANPDQPALQIEAGKYYRTRDGRKVGPMFVGRDGECSGFPWTDRDSNEFGRWSQEGEDGETYMMGEADGDLIAEWQEDQPAPAETRVQCYRGEYGKPKEHGTCIKRPDGSIDWQSWRDEDT